MNGWGGREQKFVFRFVCPFVFVVDHSSYTIVLIFHSIPKEYLWVYLKSPFTGVKRTFELVLQNIHNFSPRPDYFIAEPADPAPFFALGMSVKRSIAPSRNLPKAPTYPERYGNRDGGMDTLNPGTTVP